MSGNNFESGWVENMCICSRLQVSFGSRLCNLYRGWWTLCVCHSNEFLIFCISLMHTNVEVIYSFNYILLMVSHGELLFVFFLPWDLPCLLSYSCICHYTNHLDPVSEVILNFIFFLYRILCLVYSIPLKLYIVKIFNSSESGL